MKFTKKANRQMCQNLIHNELLGQDQRNANWFVTNLVLLTQPFSSDTSFLYIVDNSNGTQHTMFDDDDQSCYDFDDDLDELYELAMFLIKANPMAILNEVSLPMPLIHNITVQFSFIFKFTTYNL